MALPENDLPEVSDGFEIGIVQSDTEVDELVEFNAKVHNRGDAVALRHLIKNLPDFSREMNFYIRDTDKDMIVSSLNAIPSTWDYDGVPLKNLELGYVGTLEGYRRRGFMRILYQLFEKHLHDGEYDISTIQGIPYVYRNFGYDFILPLAKSVSIRVDQIPAKDESYPSTVSDVSIREAQESDLGAIMKLYDQQREKFLVTARRSQELWTLQERFKKEYAADFTTLVVETGGAIVGYFRLVSRGDASKPESGATLDVIESSIVSYSGILATLKFLRTEALSKGLYRITLPGSRLSNLARLALDMGGEISRGWKYQIRIPDMLRFLRKIQPVLETRLNGTMFEGLSYTLPLNTYRHCYELEIVGGAIVGITDSGPSEVGDKTDVRAPPMDFVRLVLGDYRIDELSKMNIDFLVSGKVKSLVSTLFPRKESLVSYFHC
ncbi:MAG: GNAT family N-acetyltransferase [Candidatus Thorarchaeota archaeon]|nr:GNAT family N-acetyltransferase [Candidatus Thorarchaeota archaeon]